MTRPPLATQIANKITRGLETLSEPCWRSEPQPGGTSGLPLGYRNTFRASCVTLQHSLMIHEVFLGHPLLAWANKFKTMPLKVPLPSRPGHVPTHFRGYTPFPQTPALPPTPPMLPDRDVDACRQRHRCPGPFQFGLSVWVSMMVFLGM